MCLLPEKHLQLAAKTLLILGIEDAVEYDLALEDRLPFGGERLRQDPAAAPDLAGHAGVDQVSDQYRER